jgi:hypothetical protein
MLQLENNLAPLMDRRIGLPPEASRKCGVPPEAGDSHAAASARYHPRLFAVCFPPG